MKLIFQSIATLLFVKIFFSSQVHGADQVGPCICYFKVLHSNKLLYEEEIGQFWGLGGSPWAINQGCQSLCTQKVIEKFNAKLNEICLKLGANYFSQKHDISIGFRSSVRSKSCNMFSCSTDTDYGSNDNVRIFSTEKCPDDRCKCKLRYHKTSINQREPDLSKSVFYPNSYPSSCETSCQSHVLSFMGSSSQERMDKTCADLSAGVSIQEHGIALWYEKYNEPHLYDKNICCHAKCECNVLNGKNALLKELETPKKNIGFHCGTHLKDCMIDCRNSAALYFENQLIVNSTLATPDLNIFNAPNYNSVAAMFVCSKINEQTTKQGVPIYLQYNTGLNFFPYTEKLHLGNICCLKVREGLVIPINCKDMDLIKRI